VQFRPQRSAAWEISGQANYRWYKEESDERWELIERALRHDDGALEPAEALLDDESARSLTSPDSAGQ